MIEHVVRVACEGEGCTMWCIGARVGPRSTEAGLARSARRRVRARSWIRVRGPAGRHVDLCPYCAILRRIELKAAAD